MKFKENCNTANKMYNMLRARMESLELAECRAEKQKNEAEAEYLHMLRKVYEAICGQVFEPGTQYAVKLTYEYREILGRICEGEKTRIYRGPAAARAGKRKLLCLFENCIKRNERAWGGRCKIIAQNEFGECDRRIDIQAEHGKSEHRNLREKLESEGWYEHNWFLKTGTWWNSVLEEEE